MKSIILATDYLYGYRLRNKLMDNGLSVEFINQIDSLIKFFVDNDEGVVFIKSNSQRVQSYVKAYSLLQQKKNYIFVLLVDVGGLHIEVDNKTLFVSNFERVHELIPMLKKSAFSKLCCCDSIPKSKIEELTLQIFNTLKFPTNIMGYNFINDAVEIMLTDTECNTCLKKVYDILAQRYNKTVPNIEKAIRVAITNFIKAYPDTVKGVFIKDRLSNSEFISYMIDKVKELYCKSVARPVL